LIDRVLLTPLAIIPVAAGDVMHAMRRSDGGFRDFGEAYFTWIEPRATKGWKRHRQMTLNMVVPVGSVAFAVVDAEARIGRHYELGPEAYGRLTVPPGLWMAFRGLASLPSLVLNIADQEHDPTEADRAPEEAFAFDWSASKWPAGADQKVLS